MVAGEQRLERPTPSEGRDSEVGAAPPDLGGELARRWRQGCTDLRSVTEAAAVLGVTKAALSQWETGARPIGADTAERMDAAYGAAGALADLLAAVHTPRTLPRRTTWEHNFPRPEGGQGWVWVRTDDGEDPVDVSLSLGPFTMTHQVACGPLGQVFGVRATIANPATAVRLSRPGWVDFGRGSVLPALGLPLLDAADAATFRSDSDPIIKIIAREFGRALHGHDAAARLIQVMPGLSRLSEGALEEFLSAPSAAPLVVPVPRSDAEAQPTSDRITPPLLADIRGGRGYSRARAAAAATDLLPEHPVTAVLIENLERGHQSRVPLLLSRLDRLYRLDGNLTAEQVLRTPRATRRLEVPFHVPPFWVGPVWFRFLGPAGTSAAAQITIRPWTKRLMVEDGGVATCRSSQPNNPPFVVTLPAGWALSAGLGRVPATDINAHWHLSHPADVAQLLPHYLAIAVRAVGEPSSTRQRLLGLLRSGRAH